MLAHVITGQFFCISYFHGAVTPIISNHFCNTCWIWFSLTNSISKVCRQTAKLSNRLLKLSCVLVIRFVIFFLSFVFSGLHPPAHGGSQARGRIGATAAAYARATAKPDPSRICDLHHSSQQRWILNPLSEARDGTCNLMVPSQICFCCAATGTPKVAILINASTRSLCSSFLSFSGRTRRYLLWNKICKILLS